MFQLMSMLNFFNIIYIDKKAQILLNNKVFPAGIPENSHTVLAVNDDLVLKGSEPSIPHVMRTVHCGQNLEFKVFLYKYART